MVRVCLVIVNVRSIILELVRRIFRSVLRRYFVRDGSVNKCCIKVLICVVVCLFFLVRCKDVIIIL